MTTTTLIVSTVFRHDLTVCWLGSVQRSNETVAPTFTYTGGSKPATTTPPKPTSPNPTPAVRRPHQPHRPKRD